MNCSNSGREQGGKIRTPKGVPADRRNRDMILRDNHTPARGIMGLMQSKGTPKPCTAQGGSNRDSQGGADEAGADRSDRDPDRDRDTYYQKRSNVSSVLCLILS